MARQGKPRKQDNPSQERNKKGLVVGGLVALGLLGIGGYLLSGGDEPQGRSDSTEQALASSSFESVPLCRVFVENSGSMDGYVQAVNSQFKSDLNALLSGIETLHHEGSNRLIVDSMALNYINSNIIPIHASRVSNFTEGLSIQSFRKGGGNRSSTSLQDLLGRIQEETAEGEVSILVSDMILGLKSGQSPESVSTNIETDLRRQLSRRPEWSVVVWRMLSDFEGAYYQKGGKVEKLSGVKRPYYIIFMGDRAQLRSILSEGQLPSNLPLFQNRTHELSLEPRYGEVTYHIEHKASLGTIKLDRRDRHAIAEARRDEVNGRTGLSFDLKMQRPFLLQSSQSLLNASHYRVEPSSYSIERVWETSDKDGIKLRLFAPNVVRGKVSISYLQAMPSWVEEVHSDQDANIRAEGSMERTYGIRYILEGLRRPYETTAQTLFSLPITIN